MGLAGLQPDEIYQVLLDAGVFAPAVSSTEHVVEVLKSYSMMSEKALDILRANTIKFVRCAMYPSSKMIRQGPKAAGVSEALATAADLARQRAYARLKVASNLPR